MPLLILRSFFILASSGIGVAIVRGGVIGSSAGGLTTFVLLVILALAVVGLDMAFPKKKIAWISAYYFGLLIGLITTYIMGLALEPFFEENVGEAAGSGDAAALTEATMRTECAMCTRTGSEVNTCAIRQALLVCAAPEIVRSEGTLSGCEYENYAVRLVGGEEVDLGE